MKLWEFYEHVEKLVLDLRSSGYPDESEQVEVAMRGGATSGEILGGLSAARPTIARQLPEFSAEVDVLARLGEGSLGAELALSRAPRALRLSLVSRSDQLTSFH